MRDAGRTYAHVPSAQLSAGGQPSRPPPPNQTPLAEMTAPYPRKPSLGGAPATAPSCFSTFRSVSLRGRASTTRASTDTRAPADTTRLRRERQRLRLGPAAHDGTPVRVTGIAHVRVLEGSSDLLAEMFRPVDDDLDAAGFTRWPLVRWLRRQLSASNAYGSLASSRYPATALTPPVLTHPDFWL